MGPLARALLTGTVVLAAVAVIAYKYWSYVTNPWTRDGQVRAQVIQITPRVSGPIVRLPIDDNQVVSSGDLLFEIDPRTFVATLDSKRADLDKTRDDIEALKTEVEAAAAAVNEYESQIKQAKSAVKRYEATFADAKATFERINQAAKTGAVSRQQVDNAKAKNDEAEAQVEEAQGRLQEATADKLQAEANLAKARADLGAPGDQNARLRAAQAAVRTAELDLEFTQVRAPVDGYVTNLNIRLGDQAVQNQPVLALVDTDSYWVHGFFRETVIPNVRPGNLAVVTLMAYPDIPLEGRVHSIGRGIAQDDGSTGFELLPNVSPTFEWIRLAQRVPVRIHLTRVPAEIELIVGTTASVLVMTGTEDENARAIDPAPQALQ